MRRRLAKQHDLARKKREATDRVEVEVGTEVLRVASTGWSGNNAGYGARVYAPDLKARGVELIRYEFVSSSDSLSSRLLARAVLACNKLMLSPLRLPRGKPTALVTSDGYHIVVRTSKMNAEMLDRLDRFTKWMHEEPQASQLSSDPNQRGAHRLGLYGTTRAYSKVRKARFRLGRSR